MLLTDQTRKTTCAHPTYACGKHSVNDYCAQIMKDNAVDLNNCAIEEDENEEGASVFHYESQPNDKNLQH